MQQKVILIAGIGHSGSTILDMALGCHPAVIGLGEISKVLRTPPGESVEARYEHSVCSCGSKACECDFWRPLLQWLGDNHHLPLQRKYEKLLTRFRAQFGDNRILLDSSKTVRPYQAWLNQHHDLHAIHLTRDVRSWIDSRLHGDDPRDKGGTLRLAARWWRGNRRTARFLAKHSITTFNLGYEELALHPEAMLEKLCEWLGLAFDPAMLKPAATNSHIIRGNLAAQDKARTHSIRYDARWMTSSRLILQSPLLLPLAAYNRRLVYANTTEQANTTLQTMANNQEKHL